MEKMKLLLRMEDIFDMCNDSEYYFPIKGHNLKDEEVISYINKELSDEEFELIVDKIIAKDETCYTVSRFYEGEEAKDSGFNYWVEFHKIEEYKKGFGKSTSYTLTLKQK